VDFELSDEQIALGEATRALLAQRWRSDRCRAALDNPPVLLSDDLWDELAAAGWTGMMTDVELGGSGADVATTCVLAEEAARALLPEAPFSTLIAAFALERSGDERWRSEAAHLAEGSRRAACAVEEPTGSWGPDAVTLGARTDGDQLVLSGTKVLVPDTEGTTSLLVAARGPSWLGYVVVPTGAAGLTITPMRRMDAQSIAEVALDEVRVPAEALLGGPAEAESLLRDAYDLATVLTCADLLGVAEAVLATAVEYAGQREQFGRPIGSFQAVAHPLADRRVEVEIGRSLLYAACLALDEHRPNAPAHVSAAKAWLSEAAVQTAETAVAVHGGIGFTWELDVHLYLRRALAGAASHGDADHHRDRVADLLDAGLLDTTGPTDAPPGG
jgi:alkylation response protein AidB-like acyl-CoA dehydrogenase